LTQIEVMHKQKLENPFALDDLSAAVEPGFMNRARPMFATGGLLALKTSHAVLRALLAKEPAAQNLVRLAVGSRWNPLASLPRDQQFAFQQQQDAVLTSLALAGLNRRNHLEFHLDPNATPKSFLALLPESRFREDVMLINDYQQLPGFEAVRRFIQNAVQFTDGKTTLTVLLVNRQPLESLIGTDLIYYNETYKSFVMVQYKALEKEGKDEVFRLPNANLDDELNRMKIFFSELSEIAPHPLSPSAFRFHNNPFFLKFCPRVVQDPDSVELIPGMYFPIDYWTLLQTSPLLDGPNGGRLLNYENADRYLTNTEFTTFVCKAWAGTRVEQSAMLEQLIRKTLETGKCVTLAQVSKAHPQIGEQDAVLPPNGVQEPVADEGDTDLEST
jgi:hypothetical protein